MPAMAMTRCRIKRGMYVGTPRRNGLMKLDKVDYAHRNGGGRESKDELPSDWSSNHNESSATTMFV
jgi:hypothetical protein